MPIIEEKVWYVSKASNDTQLHATIQPRAQLMLSASSVQVQQHLDRMQQQKEAVAMEKLRALMPQLGDVVRALALAKADWDIDLAVNMLRSFQVAHLDKLNTLKNVGHIPGFCAGLQ